MIRLYRRRFWQSCKVTAKTCLLEAMARVRLSQASQMQFQVARALRLYPLPTVVAPVSVDEPVDHALR